MKFRDFYLTEAGLDAPKMQRLYKDKSRGEILYNKIKNKDQVELEDGSSKVISVDSKSMKNFDKMIKTQDYSNFKKEVIMKVDGQQILLKDISKTADFGGQSGGLGEGGGSIKAEDWEGAIAVMYNMIKMGMDRDKAIYEAGLIKKKYEKKAAGLEPTARKIVEKLTQNLGKRLLQTGATSVPVSKQWLSKDKTPKTDILGDLKNKLSLKQAGGSQLVSGFKNDAKSLFIAAMEFYNEHQNGTVPIAKEMIKEIEKRFSHFNVSQSIGTIRQRFEKWYIETRLKEINRNSVIKKMKKTTKAPKKLEKEIEDHIKAEGINSKFFRGVLSKKEIKLRQIKGVDFIDAKKFSKYYETYIKKAGNRKFRDEIKNVLEGAVNNELLDSKVKDALEKDHDLKKWVIFEAASGIYKFTGDTDLETKNIGAANKIMKFDIHNNKTIFIPITPKWAKEYAGHVKTLVGFKSAGRTSSSAFRMIVAENLETELEKLLTEEIKNSEILLNEGIMDLIKSGIQKTKDIAKSIIYLFKNIFKKLIDKLKEWAKNGVEFVLEKLGFEIQGEVNFVINF